MNLRLSLGLLCDDGALSRLETVGGGGGGRGRDEEGAKDLDL